MPLTAAPTVTKIASNARPVKDEWGVYDPQQAGIPATMRALEDATGPAAPPIDTPAASFTADSDAALSDASALYTVESPLRCPQCHMAIKTFRALRVLRTHVNFMSTLPRKGYVLVCPRCAGLLSAELSGLL